MREARIDGERTKSLGTMRQKVAAEHPASTRANDVNRYTVAVHELGRLKVQTEELAKAIQGVARNIKTAADSCQCDAHSAALCGGERAAK